MDRLEWGFKIQNNDNETARYSLVVRQCNKLTNYVHWLVQCLVCATHFCVACTNMYIVHIVSFYFKWDKRTLYHRFDCNCGNELVAIKATAYFRVCICVCVREQTNKQMINRAAQIIKLQMHLTDVCTLSCIVYWFTYESLHRNANIAWIELLVRCLHPIHWLSTTMHFWRR